MRGKAVRGEELTELQKRVVKLYADGRGLTMEQIRVEVGCSYGLVNKILHGSGARVAPRSRRPKEPADTGR